MKKLLFALCIASISLTGFAQSNEKDDVLTGKSGTRVLPQAGDWAIGINATPFFQYVGNFFSQNGNPYKPEFAFTAQHPGAIYSKYRLSSKTALRAILILGVSAEEDKILNTTNPDSPHTMKSSAFTIGGIVGIEKNKSIIGRVSAFYGAQAGIQNIAFSNGTMSGNVKYTDKNNANLSYEETGGSTLAITAGGFAGIEYFFLPRVSVTGEVGVDFGANFQSDRERQLGTSAKEPVENGGWDISLAPVASGDLSVFIYF